MVKSSLCDYSDACILFKGTITVVGGGAGDAVRVPDRKNKQAILKNCATFSDCITEINNTQRDNTNDLDFVMLMYNLREHSQNYLELYSSFAEMSQKIL